MARVVYLDTPEAFDELIYPAQHPNNAAWIAQQFENTRSMVTDINRSFQEQTRALYETYRNSQAVQIAKHAIQQIRTYFTPDIVQRLKSVEECNAATPVMQRWIMAEPNLRQLHIEQRCDGFHGSYIDIDPGTVGEQHYDYRRVMSGVVQEDPDNPDDWGITFYIEELREGDIPLSPEQQLAIVGTWDIIAYAVKHGNIDPSSITGAKLF